MCRDLDFFCFFLLTRGNNQRDYDDISHRKSFSENERLDKIEKKLSSIEHRLSYIEEKSEDVQHRSKMGRRSVRIRDIGDQDSVSRSSSESGIHEGRDYDEEDRDDLDFVDKEMSQRRQMEKDIEDYGDENDIQKSVNKVEIREMQAKVPEEDQGSGLRVWDIMSHKDNTTGGTVMFKLFEDYPADHRMKPSVNLNQKVNIKKINELTLGIPRKVRRAKIRSPQKQITHTLAGEKELIGKSMSRQCRFCKCDNRRYNTREQTANILTFDNQQEYLTPSFPPRKLNSKRSFIAPVECECRSDPDRNKGPLLSITGHQVPLIDRDIYT